MRRGVFALSLTLSSWAVAQQPGTQVFAFVDAREQVVSGKAPPTRTGTNHSMVGIPSPAFEFGADMPVSSGLGMYFQGYCFTAWRMRAQGVPVEPSREPRAAFSAVAPRPGERPALVFVINEWWDEGYANHTCRKALTAYAVGPGGVVLAQSSAADHECLLTFGRSAQQQRDGLFASLVSTPTMTAALNGQLVAPPVTAPPPPPVTAPPPPPGVAPVAPPPASPAGCSPAQVAKLKGYGLSDDDVRRACSGTK